MQNYKFLMKQKYIFVFQLPYQKNITKIKLFDNQAITPALLAERGSLRAADLVKFVNRNVTQSIRNITGFINRFTFVF